MEPLATSAEVAAFLNVHPQTMDRWASRRQGPPYIKVEGSRRYVWAEVRTWLEERTVRNG